MSVVAPMKFGVMFANAGNGAQPAFAAELVHLIEELGFESLWTVEHVVLPASFGSQYPYSPDGKIPGGEEAVIPDPLIWLSYVAALTKRIKLATGIVILPQRNPLILAKEVASLDLLSSGRMILGVGVGWLREEFDAIGVPWEARGARTDEYIEALREVWASDSPTFKGRFVEFTNAKSRPKPFNGHSVPIHIGGHTDAAAARAGRLGDGFFPGKGDIVHQLEVMRAAAADAGRDPSLIEVTRGGKPDYDSAGRLRDHGVARMTVGTMGFDLKTIKAKLGEFSENVIARFV